MIEKPGNIEDLPEPEAGKHQLKLCVIASPADALRYAAGTFDQFKKALGPDKGGVDTADLLLALVKLLRDTGKEMHRLTGKTGLKSLYRDPAISEAILHLAGWCDCQHAVLSGGIQATMRRMADFLDREADETVVQSPEDPPRSQG